jgi:hypothetical protein
VDEGKGEEMTIKEIKSEMDGEGEGGWRERIGEG